jgi:uncharacterized caspase-like protein
MAFAGSAVNIVILDACRNNPLSRGFRAISRGLADPTVRPEGSFIAYSTAPGDVADDGKGTNSPFTKALAESITKPGASINDVFQDVRGKVRAATNKKQVPWDSSSLTAPFYFVPAVQARAPTSAAVEAQNDELLLWNEIKDSKSPEDYQAYLDKYPDGAFAPLAKLRAKSADQTAERVLHASPEPAEPGAVEDSSIARQLSSLSEQISERRPCRRRAAAYRRLDRHAVRRRSTGCAAGTEAAAGDRCDHGETLYP